MALSTTFTEYVLEITELGKKNNAKMAISPFKVIQGHQFWYQSKAHIYDFLLVINTNVPPILHRFGVLAFQMSKIAIFRYPSCI